MFNLFKSPNTPNLAEMIEKGAFLVDVRTQSEFATGSVKGAVNIPLDQVLNKIDQFRNKSGVIVFCRSGGRSGQAKSILESAGIANVANGGPWENVAKFKK